MSLYSHITANNDHSEACIAGILKGRKRGFGAREKREGCARARERNLLSSPSRTREFPSPSLFERLPRRLTIRFSWQDQPFGFHGYPFNKWGPDMCLKNNQIFKGNILNSCCLAAYPVIVYWGSTNMKAQDPKPLVYNCRCFLSFLEAALEIAFAPWMDMVLKYTFTHHPRWGPVEWR